ncbi:hypothetical protein N657DRAFT_611905 [Parathielavia appendiculata]|uniref:Rho-GAP domain-containing protein n=1 Tax=Parathielavia appendiculata TaxID=2587402 RepID=A0AAN6Z6C6_9PEZI|nr:hypothetical protein N657DRAFT_611905 [Parathielavia appendiculata]
MNATKRDSLKDEDLVSLVRICGKSKLYLPSEYSPGSLVLPTCFRATAQYLVQHAAQTRGVFRIPGSVRIVNALYAYYCADGDADDISSTISCPNLPSHIKARTHDVASAFKRLLSGLPGGILGSLTLFEALVGIQNQLDAEAEILKTKQTKLKARLMALAIGAVRSQLRRDLICAVFGLLCLIGRAAETAPREDEHGRPLPTSDLMGYNALGIVFGPLLVGDLLNSYDLKIAGTATGRACPVTSPTVRKDRRRSNVVDEARPSAPPSIDKIHVANSITEMLITHWREVVRHMRSLGVLKSGQDGSQTRVALRPSTESFKLSMPHPHLDVFDSRESSFPLSPTPGSMRGMLENSRPPVVLPRRRPRAMRPLSSTSAGVHVSLLSPPVEEPSPAEFKKPGDVGDDEHRQRHNTQVDNHVPSVEEAGFALPNGSSPFTGRSAGLKELVGFWSAATTPVPPGKQLAQTANKENTVPSREAIKMANSPAASAASTRPESVEQRIGAAFRGANPFKRRSYKGNSASNSTERISQDTPRWTFRGSFEAKALQDEKTKMDVFGRGRPRLAGWKLRRRSFVSTGTESAVSDSLGTGELTRGTRAEENSSAPQSHQSSPESNFSSGLGHRSCSNGGHGDCLGNDASYTQAEQEVATKSGSESFARGSPMYVDSSRFTQPSSFVGQFRPLQTLSANTESQRRCSGTSAPGYSLGSLGKRGCEDTGAAGHHPENRRPLPSGPRPNPAQPTLGHIPRSVPAHSVGSGVKAMAAMFESVSQTPDRLPSLREKPNVRTDSRSSGMLSPYTVNPAPAKSRCNSPKPIESISGGRRPWMSAIRHHDLRGSRGSMPGGVVRDNSGVGRGRRSVSETARGKTTSPRHSTAVPFHSEATVEKRLCQEATTLKQPDMPGTRSLGLGAGESPSVRDILVQDASDDNDRPTFERTGTIASIPIDPKQDDLTTTPDLSPSSRQSTPFHTPSKQAEPSPASTTPRFPLVRIPEHHHQGKTPENFHPGQDRLVPVRDSIPAKLIGPASTTPPGSPPGPSPGIWHDFAKQEDAKENKLARLRAKLRQTEKECALWKARAERAERKVLLLERVDIKPDPVGTTSSDSRRASTRDESQPTDSSSSSGLAWYFARRDGQTVDSPTSRLARECESREPQPVNPHNFELASLFASEAPQPAASSTSNLLWG